MRYRLRTPTAWIGMLHVRPMAGNDLPDRRYWRRWFQFSFWLKTWTSLSIATAAAQAMKFKVLDAVTKVVFAELNAGWLTSRISGMKGVL